MNFFEELKRRNVFRVGIAYLIGGWLVIQVADIVLENIGAPAWVMQAIFLLIALGFVVAVFFAWAFEATPEGIKRESEVDRSKSITAVTGRKLDRAIIALLVIALAYFVWESRIATRVPLAQPTEASVAVLAFENMSPDPENAYFAEGISEEILNVLAAVNGLRVASRTSAFSFADTDTPIPDIASQLGVAHVLEGSVRKQGSRVRITAQLIDAANDKHLWSEIYDRDLHDIFVVQEEIAAAISNALLGALGISQIALSAPTDDLAAYELFLRGRQQFHARGVGPIKSAIADLRSAVERDPDFAEAWSYLAASLSVITGYERVDAAEYDAYRRESRIAADRALVLDPGQALAVAVLGQNFAKIDRLKRTQIFNKAVKMAPDDSTILMWAGNDLFTAGGYLDETLPILERAYRLDPLSGIKNGILGMAYLAAVRRNLAYQHIRRANELGWPHGSTAMALDLFDQGQVDAAIEVNRAFWPADESLWRDSDRMAWEFLQRVMRGEVTSDDVAAFETSGVLDEQTAGWDVFHYQVLGDHERMFDAWLAIEADRDFLFRRVFYPGGRAVMEHPRMLEVAEKLLLIPVWESKGYPFGCERVQDGSGDHLGCPDWPQ